MNNIIEPIIDFKNERILMPNGDSVISPEKMKEKLLEGTDSAYVVIDGVINKDKDLEPFFIHYNEDIGCDDIIMPIDFSMVRTKSVYRGGYTKKRVLQDTIDLSPRKKNTVEERVRIETEFDYITKNDHTTFILELYNLICAFKKNNVVWGVGRGSSCACYLLYLLQIHDIDSLEFDIPFKEFSKEDLDDE